MSDIPTLYQGEGILLAWADTSSRGRTVTFMLEDSMDADAVHPFKGINYGKTGQRVGIVVVALREDEHPAEQLKPEKPKQSWESMSYAQRSGILRNDERFQEWLGISRAEDAAELAAEYIRKQCRVESCAHIDQSEDASERFDLVEQRYRQATGQATELRS